MQFAVIKTGGKQYKVAAGDTIKIEKLADTLNDGDAITFSDVLLVADDSQAKVGTPTISGATVKGTLIAKGRAPKILVVKYKQKSRYMKRNGHRQPYFAVKIDSIKA
jgi:large subunit ribosomal protein L21